MIWNDHRLIDVGNHIALAAMAASFHQMAWEPPLAFPAVGYAGPVGRGCSHRCDCSTASILAVASENNLLM